MAIGTWPGAIAAEPSKAACAHCGLPVAAAEPDVELSFCCDGCRTVHEILHAAGLDEYYAQRAAEGASARPARTTHRAYAEFDDPAFTSLYVHELGSGLATTELYAEGVHCAACVWLVERVPAVLGGVAEARLDFGRAIVRVTYDPNKVELSEIARTLDSFGYPVRAAQAMERRDLERAEDRKMLMRIGVAGFAAGNTMLMAFALYSGLFSSIEPEFVRLFRWGSLIVILPAMLWSAAPFFRSALGALRARTAHMDIPVALGLGAGFVWSAFGTLAETGDVYFDSLSSLIFLLLVGRWIQRRAQRRARDAGELLESLAPSRARLLEGGVVREVPIHSVPVGAEVEVLAGDPIPIDGVVLSGASSVDSSLLTGESVPVEVGVSERVFAGTTNVGARLVILTEATGQSTRLGQLVTRMQDAAARRAPIVRLADRVSAVFVTAMVVAAALTFAVWLSLDPAHALDHAVALLVVSCPCALGLATPLAVSAAIGQAARRGILIKGGDALEALAGARHVVFDKTGTLTEGRLDLAAYDGDAVLFGLLVRAEATSSHPIARALARAPSSIDSNEDWSLDSVQHELGAGLRARFTDLRRGAVRELTAGSPTFVQNSVGPLPDSVRAAIAAHASVGNTPVVVGDGQTWGVAGLADPLRADVRSSLERIKALGVEVSVLSGDHPAAVQAVCARLGRLVDHARGATGPEQKQEQIEALARAGSVVMVGDGVNDAAALASATVGIAVHGGAEASLAAADAFATQAGVAPVAELLESSRRALWVIRRGVAFSLAYNVVGVSLAAIGWLGPLQAAILMPLSSLTVILHGYRSRSFGASRARASAPCLTEEPVQ